MKPLTQDEVLALLRREREYQDNLPAHRSDHRQLTVGDYLTLMRGYQIKADLAFEGSPNTDSTLDVVRKITALGFACMEKHGAPPRV